MNDDARPEANPAQILVVDDTLGSLKLLIRILNTHGYRVRPATSGRLAIRSVAAEAPDLILLDVKMPEMDGYEVCRRLKSEQQSRDIPVIFISALEDTEDKVKGFNAGGVDYITKPYQPEEVLARVRTHLHLRRLQVHLERANRELESFSYSVSHDLRAPLRHISGFIELLKKREKGRLDETSQRYLNTITESTAKMNQLIHDLLSLSRAGRTEMNSESIPMEPLIKEVIAELSTETDGRDILWNISPLPIVKADPGLLKQVLINLVSNAVKYTSQRPRAVIEIGTLSHHPPVGDAVGMYIRDNGVGFDPQYAEQLFGVFKRLHGDDEFRGTGIGLAIVERIIERHGGRVWAEGVPDKGATFSFSLSRG